MNCDMLIDMSPHQPQIEWIRRQDRSKRNPASVACHDHEPLPSVIEQGTRHSAAFATECTRLQTAYLELEYMNLTDYGSCPDLPAGGGMANMYCCHACTSTQTLPTRRQSFNESFGNSGP